MWIDAMYIFPFVILGIERIIDSGKTRTYFISLILAIFTNYYIGFMVCIFSCIYFVYYYVCSLDKINAKKSVFKNDRMFIDKISHSFFFRSGVKFAFASLGAAVVLLFMLVPLLYVLQSSSATKGSAPTEINFYFNIFDFVANHLASLEPTIRSSGDDVLPNVYCGILTIILIPLYVFSNKISSTEKAASAILLAVMYFSFNLNYLNFAWHGLHFPNDLPYRQSFMYSFILVVLAAKALKNINEFNKKQILAVGVAIIAYIVLVQELPTNKVLDSTVYISIVFVFLLTIVLGLIVSKKNQAFALSVMLVCSVAAESITANTDHYVANQLKATFASDYDNFKTLQATIKESDDSLFYREETTRNRARMDPSWYDYNGVSIFSSMAYEKVADLQKSIGLYGNKINSFTYNPQTPVYNSMFSLKYLYDKAGYLSAGEFYTEKGSVNTFTAYENNYMLNIAYPVSNELLNWDASLSEDPVKAQEELFEKSTGVSGVYERIYDYEILYSNILSLDRELLKSGTFVMNKVSNDFGGSITVDITAKTNKNIYIYLYSRNLDAVSIISPSYNNSMNVLDGYILDIGKHEIGETISIEMPLKDDVSYANVDFCVFAVNEEKFIEGYNKLQSGQLEYTKFEDTVIKGTFAAEKAEILFTSIPYDIGWNVYIDGKKVSNEDIVKISDSLLGVKVDEGEHSITFLYEAKYLSETLLISTIFVIALFIRYILRKKEILFYKNKKENLWEFTENQLEYPKDFIDEEFIIEFDIDE